MSVASTCCVCGEELSDPAHPVQYGYVCSDACYLQWRAGEIPTDGTETPARYVDGEIRLVGLTPDDWSVLPDDSIESAKTGVQEIVEAMDGTPSDGENVAVVSFSHGVLQDIWTPFDVLSAESDSDSDV